MNVRNYNVIEGIYPVLISAPHVFSHKRPSIRGVMKQGELNTDVLAKLIAQKTGAWVIYLTESSTEYDPNYHKLENNLYKSEIKNLVKEKKINTVIDIHGLNDFHHYDLGVFYGMRFRKSRDIAQSLVSELGKKRPLKDLTYCIGYTSKNLQETITEFVNEKLRLPAIQIEIAKYIRFDPELLENMAEGIAQLIKKL
jgi:hypothetical protein